MFYLKDFLKFFFLNLYNKLKLFITNYISIIKSNKNNLNPKIYVRPH